MMSQVQNPAVALNFLLTLPKATNVDRKREQALIKAAQRGDTQAFAELYNACVHQVYRYIYYRIPMVNVAEDLTADVFVRVLEGLPTYQDRSVPILAWIYRIAHARMVDYFRNARQTFQHDDVDDVELSVEDDLDGTLTTTYQVTQIQAAMRKLNEEQRRVIVLRFIEGYSLEMSAQLLGKSVASIKSLQFRAVKALNQALKSQGFDPTER